ncbi:MAG: asparagine synthase (glutamine-hydrolyzing) [Victivallales bacterium]|nr:asparagine synthase (glutamine-hydrolyzing) [Victivallales bacterium]
MCGICGIFNIDGSSLDRGILEAMNNSQVHRGPDGEGLWTGGNVGLAHRRLSIIDLSAGVQPMCNEDSSVFITYNGEIYNHRDLRRILESKGHIFKTSCDTEVVLHLYEEYGKNCVDLLLGMFAFAIFDTRRRSLLLARDRMGQKPLVYFMLTTPDGKPASFVFASEMQALKTHPRMPREINPQALHDYMTLQYVPSPDTIYKVVRKLPQGHILEIAESNPAPRITQYWRCNFSEKLDIGFDEASTKLQSLLEDAVRKRLMADVPLGAFLSGGIDSTIVVSLMKKFSLMPIKTFTIGFEDQKYDERSFALVAAGALDTEHRQKVVNPADFNILEKLVRHYGEPFSDASMLPTYLLSQFTCEYVKVALSGDGADEIFAGYYRYLVMNYARIADFMPLAVRKAVCGILAAPLPPKTEERTFWGRARRILEVLSSSRHRRYLDMISRFDEKTKFSVYSADFANLALQDTQRIFDVIAETLSAKNPVEKIMETDLLTYLPGDILAKIDIASMANSLELRSPFMDHRVVEFAASLPLNFKQSRGNRKHILIESFRHDIPQKLRERGKMGFGVPIARWLRNEWKDIARERLLDGIAVKSNLFNRSTIEKMLDNHCNSKCDNSYPLWSLLVLNLWLEQK